MGSMKNNMKKDTILSVNKANFWIYVGCMITAILITISGAICYVADGSFVGEILIEIGCGIFPTVIFAYLLDLANGKRLQKEIKTYRRFILFGIPHGILWLAKVVVDNFYNKNEQSNFSFKDTFDLAASAAIEIPEESYDTIFKEHLKKDTNYGLDLIARDTGAIIGNKTMLLMKNVFSESEILALDSTFSQCEPIRRCERISEKVEYIKVLVDWVYECFPEIENMMKRVAIVKNRHIQNWNEIQNEIS